MTLNGIFEKLKTFVDRGLKLSLLQLYFLNSSVLTSSCFFWLVASGGDILKVFLVKFDTPTRTFQLQTVLFY